MSNFVVMFVVLLCFVVFLLGVVDELCRDI